MKSLLLISQLLFFTFSYSQEKEIFLLFNSTVQPQTCNWNEKDKVKNEYEKGSIIKNSKELTTYYINHELFQEIPSQKSSIHPCSIIKRLNFSDINELKAIVKKKNPLYPFKVFPNIYIIEKLHGDNYKMVKVKWLHYIE